MVSHAGDDHGLARSFFHTLIPVESGVSYCRAISVMKVLLSCKANLEATATSRSLGPRNSLQAFDPYARIGFLCFLFFTDVCKRCDNLLVASKLDSEHI